MEYDVEWFDYPLTCRWAPQPELVDRLGLNPTAALIVGDLLLAAEQPDRPWTSFSRRKVWYTGRNRYHGADFTYTKVLAGSTISVVGT